MSARDLLGLLEEMLSRLGSGGRLAQRLGVSERAVRGWLKMNDKELARLQQGSLQAIERLAADLGLDPTLYCQGASLWDISKPYEENLEAVVPLPAFPATTFPSLETSFLGYRLRSPFGAAASVVTSTSDRIGFLARTGVDILTYKTVRSRKANPYPFPNTFFCSREATLLAPEGDAWPDIPVGTEAESCFPQYGLMNRHGIPSRAPELWKADFLRARRALMEGQILILSIAGSPEAGARGYDPTSDFVRLSRVASELGVEVLELNFSCPNHPAHESQVSEDLKLTVRVVRAVRRATPTVRLLAKLGFMPRSALRPLVLETAAYVDGYSLINSVSTRGVRIGPDGPEAAFGSNQSRAGLSGPPILRLGLTAVESLAEIRSNEGLEKLVILGMGGVSSASDVQAYLDAGADVVQATTAFFSDPLFGIKVQKALASQIAPDEVRSSQEEETARRTWMVAIERLETLNPEHRDTIEHAGIKVWMTWKEVSAKERLQGPRRARKPTIDDYMDAVSREAHIYLRKR